MNEQDDNRNSPPPSGGRVLGSIPAGPRDTTLGNLRTGATSAPDRPVVPPPPLASSTDDQFTLPRGGWVAMRKSGGFKFSWREIFVYQDGRVKYVSSDRTSHVKMPAARLNENQMIELRRLLAETRFPPAASATARHSPDTFAYELVARVGRKVYTAEVFEGSIPGSLASLIQYLQRLMQADS